jgi:hypothetical protein
MKTFLEYVLRVDGTTYWESDAKAGVCSVLIVKWNLRDCQMLEVCSFKERQTAADCLSEETLSPTVGD